MHRRPSSETSTSPGNDQHQQQQSKIDKRQTLFGGPQPVDVDDDDDDDDGDDTNDSVEVVGTSRRRSVNAGSSGEVIVDDSVDEDVEPQEVRGCVNVMNIRSGF